MYNIDNIVAASTPLHYAQEDVLIQLLSSRGHLYNNDYNDNDNNNDNNNNNNDNNDDDEYSFERGTGKVCESTYLTEKVMQSSYIIDKDKDDDDGHWAVEWGSVFGITQSRTKDRPSGVR